MTADGPPTRTPVLVHVAPKAGPGQRRFAAPQALHPSLCHRVCLSLLRTDGLFHLLHLRQRTIKPDFLLVRNEVRDGTGKQDARCAI